MSNNFNPTLDYNVAAGPPKLGPNPGTKKRSPKPPKNRPEKALTLQNGVVAPCSECGRKFLSWKALFGHMRCHPERRWRGINPPPLTDEYEVATCLLLLASSTRQLAPPVVFLGLDLNRPAVMEDVHDDDMRCKYLDLRLSL